MSISRAIAPAGPPIWVLVLAVSSSNIGVSLLSPAVPLIRQSFLATADQVQLVLTGFMMALGIGQLIAGTLSDRFGRRPVMLVGSALFLLGGVGAFIATSIDMLVLMRVLQGAGAAACVVMGRVIINDSFVGADAGRQLSTITMVQAIVPIMGFAFGGAIAQSIGWQGCIVIMAISAGMTLAATFFMLQETKVEREVRIRIGRIVRAYTGLMVNPTFMANGLTSGMAVAMFFVLSGIMPYQYERYGIGPLEYGVFFCLCSVGYMAGNSVNRRFVSTLGLELASFWGALISASGVGFALLAHLADIGSATLVTACMVVMGFGHGFTVANSAVAAVRAAGADSGSAMGLVGASQMLIGGLLGSGIVAMGGDASFTIGMGSVVGIGLFGVSMSFLALQLQRAN
jgi:DHA1 family bicyclomycin/chloramphenicol resistance-like MFS transporter